MVYGCCEEDATIKWTNGQDLPAIIHLDISYVQYEFDFDWAIIIPVA